VELVVNEEDSNLSSPIGVNCPNNK
jgi:hypothetical protein